MSQVSLRMTIPEEHLPLRFIRLTDPSVSAAQRGSLAPDKRPRPTAQSPGRGKAA